MSYVLYYSPGAASMAVHWLLLELGVPFEAQLVDVKAGAQHLPEYRRLSPSGRVPTLTIDGVPTGESAALMMLLVERHRESRLAPLHNTRERAEWFEMMIYLANTVLPAMRGWFYAHADGDPEHASAVKAFARTQIESSMERIDALLGDGRDYLVRNQLTTADFLAVMLMRWTRNMPTPATSHANIANYVQRLRARPMFVELCAREGLKDWLNAAPANTTA